MVFNVGTKNHHKLAQIISPKPTISHGRQTSIKLSWRNSNVGIIFNESAISERTDSSQRPNESPPKNPGSQRHIDDDLPLSGLLLAPDGNQITASNPPNLASNVEEEDTGSNEFSPVGLVAVHNEMRQPISAAEQALFPIVFEPALGLLHGGLDGEGRGAVRSVGFHAVLQLLEGLLLPLGKRLGLSARR